MARPPDVCGPRSSSRPRPGGRASPSAATHHAVLGQQATGAPAAPALACRDRRGRRRSRPPPCRAPPAWPRAAGSATAPGRPLHRGRVGAEHARHARQASAARQSGHAHQPQAGQAGGVGRGAVVVRARAVASGSPSLGVRKRSPLVASKKRCGRRRRPAPGRPSRKRSPAPARCRSRQAFQQRRVVVEEGRDAGASLARRPAAAARRRRACRSSTKSGGGRGVVEQLGVVQQAGGARQARDRQPFQAATRLVSTPGATRRRGPRGAPRAPREARRGRSRARRRAARWRRARSCRLGRHVVGAAQKSAAAPRAEHRFHLLRRPDEVDALFALAVGIAGWRRSRRRVPSSRGAGSRRSRARGQTRSASSAAAAPGLGVGSQSSWPWS